MIASSTAHNVRRILRDYPQARENYNVLFYMTLENYGVYFTPEQKEKMMRAPSVEGVSRAARKIWRQGEFKPTETTQQRRKRAQQLARKKLTETWEFMVDPITKQRIPISL